MDPWQDQYGSGYQLTQSLMAFGRGGITGEGFSNSYQKLAIYERLIPILLPQFWARNLVCRYGIALIVRAVHCL